MLGSGDTFLLPKPGRGSIEHLWIVLTDPDSNHKALCVNITTKQDHSDLTLILNAGDHPFVRHESVIHYPDARLLDLQLVHTALNGGATCTQHAKCSASLLQRVREGLMRSRLTPKVCKVYLSGH